MPAELLQQLLGSCRASPSPLTRVVMQLRHHVLLREARVQQSLHVAPLDRSTTLRPAPAPALALAPTLPLFSAVQDLWQLGGVNAKAMQRAAMVSEKNGSLFHTILMKLMQWRGVYLCQAVGQR